VNRTARNLLLLALCAFLVVAIVVLILRSRPEREEETTREAASPRPAAPGWPSMTERPTPTVDDFHGCPPEGDGGDRVLNRLKNRIDEGQYVPMPYHLVRQLAWPRGIENHHRSHWDTEETAEVARYEGIPIAVEGYLAGAKLSGPESANCHRQGGEERDFHLWLTETPGGERDASIVAEVTPRVRAHHPRWSLPVFQRLARAGRRIRLSGWLLLDPEHPDQVGKTRGTLWELHPVMMIEVEKQGGWIRLDEPQS